MRFGINARIEATRLSSVLIIIASLLVGPFVPHGSLRSSWVASLLVGRSAPIHFVQIFRFAVFSSLRT